MQGQFQGTDPELEHDCLPKIKTQAPYVRVSRLKDLHKDMRCQTFSY